MTFGSVNKINVENQQETVWAKDCEHSLRLSTVIPTSIIVFLIRSRKRMFQLEKMLKT